MSHALKHYLDEQITQEVTTIMLGEVIQNQVSGLVNDDPEFEELAENAIGRYVEDYRESLATSAPPQPERQFATVIEFVDKFLTKMYPFTADRKQQVRWTEYWWNHPEAVVRITALWNRYEQLRVDEPATFMETFLRNHADYHMKTLMAPEGIFDSCKRADTPSVPLPSAPVPADIDKDLKG